MDLLTRDEFRSAVFARDGNKCVICGSQAKDAHHIIERRLFADGGYYVDNGASVCYDHHILAESTELSCDELRRACRIKSIVLPPHLYTDAEYDKWGNPILPNGQRLRGELFDDPSVQKIIAPVLYLFTNRVKHPRTNHLPWSPNVHSDDRIIGDLFGLVGEEIVATVKYDGEQTSIYRDGFHARSVDTPSHPSRDWLWGLHRQIGHEIPDGWRVCGENLFARHSIHYKNLPAYFMVHSIWDEHNACLAWDDVVEWSNLLGLRSVPVLRRCQFDPLNHDDAPIEFDGDPCEGFVIRVTRQFRYSEYKNVVAKWVRKDHVQTHGHWMREAIIKNELKK